jgi:hypothetical protein
VDEAVRRLDAMKTREPAGRTTPKAKRDAMRARRDAEQDLARTVARGEALIGDGLALLEKLMAIEATLERTSYIGSAYKRRALVNAAAGRSAQVIDRDLQLMAAAYASAQKIGEQNNGGDVFYPAVNRLVAEVALNAGKSRWRTLDPATVSIVKASLESSEPGFWSVVGAIELDQYQALAKRRLAAAAPKLEKAYADLHRRVKSTRMWASVYDTGCLVLPSYATRAGAKERTAAMALLAQLRDFAHSATE